MAISVAATMVCSLPAFFTAAMAVQLSEDLDFGTVGIGAAVATFFGTMALSSMHLGRIADRFGATISLRIATIGAGIAAAGIAIASTDWLTLVAWLVLAGVSAALAQPATNRLLINRVRRDRLGTAFGLKQSAPPTASMLAGLSVPAIALTVGWRWGYGLLAILAVLVAVAVGPRPPTAPSRRPMTSSGKPLPLRDRPTLVVLAASFGLAFATSSVVLAFYVDAAVRAGSSPRHAGLVFAAASFAAVATRLAAGVACDRFPIDPLRLSATLLVVGALGQGLLATGRPAVMTLGAVLGLAGTWGFPGVFWFALVRAYPETPGRITGTMAPAAIGGIVGPIAFGTLATNVGYSSAWGVSGVVAVLAAAAMLFAARQLAATRPA